MSNLLNQNTWVCLCGAQMWGRNLNWNTRWLPHRIMGRMSIWSSARGVFEVFSPRWRSVLKRDAKWWCQSEFFGLRVELFNCQPDLETEPRLVSLYRSLCLSVFLLGEIADRTTWYLRYMSSTSRRKRLAIWRSLLYTSIQIQEMCHNSIPSLNSPGCDFDFPLGALIYSP